MELRRLSLALVAVCVSLVVTSPLAAAEPKAVVELFTSQGCSSCPPADKLLGSLAHDPSVIALSLPVDYWDYLGWKDTLALHGHANRQRAYSVARGDRAVYTPQAVVNGVVHALGSDKVKEPPEVEPAVKRELRRRRRVRVPRDVSLDGVQPHLPGLADPVGPLLGMDPEVVQRPGEHPERRAVEEEVGVANGELHC